MRVREKWFSLAFCIRNLFRQRIEWKSFLLSLLATTTTIETWTMKNTRNHETMTVKKIGRRGAPKTFLLCALDTEKKKKGFFYYKPECRIWFNVAEKWRLSSACTTHYSHCLLQCECFFLFFKPKTDVEKTESQRFSNLLSLAFYFAGYHMSNFA